jgi:hypothetical protein
MTQNGRNPPLSKAQMKSFLDLSEIDDRVFREGVKIEREHPNLSPAEKLALRFPAGTVDPLPKETADPAPNLGPRELDDFLWLMPTAISRFTDRELQQLAKKIRFTLQRSPASGIFGHSKHKNQWHEFCYHAHYGPPELDWAFDQLVEPLINYRVEQLDPADAVMMTLARQWDEDDFESQDGKTMSPDLLRSAMRGALDQLALDTDCRSNED